MAMYHRVQGPAKVVVAKSRVPGGGYGVFAKSDIREGEIIEQAPFIEIPSSLVYGGKKNLLQDYVFTSHIKPNHVIVVFGYGSMYNHSLNNNVYYRISPKNPDRFLEYVALKPIRKGAELFINYGPNHHVNK